jgi:hypothetical protein
MRGIASADRKEDVMLEPKDPNEGGDSAKLDPKAQAGAQGKPTDQKGEEGTASEDEIDQ